MEKKIAMPKLPIEQVMDVIIEHYGFDQNDEERERKGIFLLGSTGIGKTSVVKEAVRVIAGNLGLEFVDYNDSVADAVLAKPEKYFLYVDFNLNDCEPSDLSGIPKEHGQGIAQRPYLWAACLSKCAGVLFLDEFTNIQRLDVMTASYKIVREQRAGFTKFSHNVLIIAAGNEPQESSAANLLPAPLARRFTIYLVLPPTVDGWASWMEKTYPGKWDRRVLAYLKSFKQEILRLPAETETLIPFPTPASWTDIACWLAQRGSLREHTIIGNLGPEIGPKFTSFLRQSIPSIEEFLQRPEKFGMLTMEQKYMTAVMVGSHLEREFHVGKSSGSKNESEAAKERRMEAKIRNALPLLRAMASVQRDFVVLAVISILSAEERFDAALAIMRADTNLGDLLKKVGELEQAFIMS